jgi:hypothetical protein
LPGKIFISQFACARVQGLATTFRVVTVLCNVYVLRLYGWHNLTSWRTRTHTVQRATSQWLHGYPKRSLRYLNSNAKHLMIISSCCLEELANTRTIMMYIYEGVTKSFRTGRLERELQMVQLPATRCSCIAILLVSLVSFAAITLCVASQRVFVLSVYFIIHSVRKLLDIPSMLS